MNEYIKTVFIEGLNSNGKTICSIGCYSRKGIRMFLDSGMVVNVFRFSYRDYEDIEIERVGYPIPVYTCAVTGKIFSNGSIEGLIDTVVEYIDTELFIKTYGAVIGWDGR